MNIEEKAKQYADKPTHSRYQENRRLKFESYKDGYTQAVTDLNAENEKLREVLREIVSAVDQEWFDAVWEGVVLEKNVKAFKKAKQLINNE